VRVMRRGWRRPSVLVTAASVTTAALCALSLVATGTVASVTASRTGRPSASLVAAARAALVVYLRHNDAPVMFARPAGNSTTDSSYNWAGYADSFKKGAVTAVSGTWTVPSVTCTAEDTITSEWVGIDGYSDKTVEQDGTIGWCYQDVPVYFTWYEMYPAGTVDVGNALLPGDQITASVSHSGKNYTLSLADATTVGNSFTDTGTCSASKCLDDSAEWIAERPEFTSTGLAPLAEFSPWDVTDGTLTASGTSGTIDSFSSVELSMVDSDDVYNLATPSSVTNGSFTTTWNDSY
jgi:hypothetical protein